MASARKTISFIVEQAAGAGHVYAKPMFGEFSLYCDGKMVGMICDDQLFVKPTSSGRAHVGSCEESPPYAVAKPCLLIDADRWDEADWLAELLRLSAAELPAPKLRKKARPLPCRAVRQETCTVPHRSRTVVKLPRRLAADLTHLPKGTIMQPHSRALIAASAYAVVTGNKAAGVYDHSAERHLRIAAEHRGDRLQAYDGDRSAAIDGTLPNLYDRGDRSYISLEAEGPTARGYDRATASSYTANVTDNLVQLYDHAECGWFSYTVQTA